MPKLLLRRGSAPNPAEGAYSAPPDPLAGLKGPTSKGRGSGGERGKEEGMGGKERGGGTCPPPTKIPGSAPV